MANSHERRKISRLLKSINKELQETLTPNSEKASKKLDLDLGLICGILALILTMAAIFEPRIRSWYLIVPILLFAAIMVIVTILKTFRLAPFGGHTSRSVVVAIGVIVLFFCYGWRIRPVIDYGSSRLRQASKDDLKEAERTLASGLRDLQRGFNVNLKRTSDPNKLPHVEEDFRNEYNAAYREKVLNVQNELLWRLGKNPQQAEAEILASLSPQDALFEEIGVMAVGGFLAGADPVIGVANHLDYLCNLLK